MKKGFTLAEILITLAVIGVVATLTMPELYTANKKKIYASALSSTVANVETAFLNMISSEAANYLNDTAFYDTATEENPSAFKVAGEIGKYLEVVNSGNTAAAADSGYSPVVGLNDTADNSTMSNGFFIKLKSGALLNLEPSLGDLVDNGHGMIQQLFILNIDVNGAVEPNKCGRDVFKYAVDTTGKIYPFGGADYSTYSGNGLWSAGGTYGCASDNRGWGCAGRLASNGFVMDY